MENAFFLIFSITMIAFWLFGVWEFTGQVLDKYAPVQTEINLGDRIYQGDDMDGATLCDWCGGHFKGDGSMERCTPCWDETR